MSVKAQRLRQNLHPPEPPPPPELHPEETGLDHPLEDPPPYDEDPPPS